jgi:ABC-type transport system involved in cytochrome c biogenesis permease subunit
MKILTALLALFLFLSFPVCAKELDMTAFSSFPVQHEGRIKPLDTFARSMLVLLSGHDSIDGMTANEWLAEVLFDPANAVERPVFRVLRPDRYGLSASKTKRYSYAEVAPLFEGKEALIAQLTEAGEKNWSEDQKELMALQEAAIIYLQLLRTFSFLLPLNVEIPDGLKSSFDLPKQGFLTLKDYEGHREEVERKIRQIIRRKGEDPNKYNEEERAIAHFGFQMRLLEQAGENNLLFRIAPRKCGDAEWLSPWLLSQEKSSSPEITAYIKSWQDMALAFLEQDADKWKDATAKAKKQSESFSDALKIALEKIYTGFHPWTLSLFLYLFAFLSYVAHTLHSNRLWYRTSFFFALAGATAQLAGIGLRIVLLERPPVGTLYESILFVSLIAVSGALILEWKRKVGMALLLGIISGLLLLFTAQGFAEEDTLKVLTAVLNTNFWLATHVLCITMGYGWCLLTFLLAHTALFREAWKGDGAALASPIKTLAILSLLFTAVGTILGGIWADQSWGRFWGWDPKENGALLIVLWLIWVLHGQIAGTFKFPAAMASYSALSVIVALAWFGVNLLNVGLHSYGFITGVATGLAAFILAETALIGVLWHKARQKATR